MKRFLTLLLTLSLCISTVNITSLAEAKSFKDVKKEHWYYKDVQKLVNAGGISGYSDGTFRPNGTITRAEFTQILIKTLNMPVEQGFEFTDTTNSWASDSISTAIANKIILRSEYGNLFKPNQPITRIEIAKMLLRALNVEVGNSLKYSPFMDCNDEYAIAAYNEYLIQGSLNKNNRYFHPEKNATRAEAASIISRAMDYINNPSKYKETAYKELYKTSDIVIDNVTSLPDVVKVNSVKEFKTKFFTAINLKKEKITFEINNYVEKDYINSNISEYLGQFTFEKSFDKGYMAEYKYEGYWIDNNSAKLVFEFTYHPIKEMDKTDKVIKVYSPYHLAEVIYKAKLNDENSIIVALKDFDKQNYDFEAINKYTNDENILKLGYILNCYYDWGWELCGQSIYELTFYNETIYKPTDNVKSAYTYDDSYNLINNAISEKAKTISLLTYDEKFSTDYINTIVNKINSKNTQYNTNVQYIQTYNSYPTLVEIWLEHLPKSEANKDIKLKTDKDIYNYIRNKFANADYFMKFDDLTDDKINYYITLVLEQNPEIDYVENWITNSNGTVKIRYEFPEKDLENIIQATNKKSEEILSNIIKTGMTETEKAKAIHDYIILNARYDEENYKNDTLPDEAYTAYGIIVNGIGVCHGYSSSFNLLAKKAGLKSIVVCGIGNDESHSWNMVRLDGKVAYIDVTWDDPIPDVKGYKGDYYFNVSAEKLSIDHTWDTDRYSEKYLDY